MLSFLASSFATFLESFLYSVKSPSRGFHFSSENAFVFFPVSSFQRKECLFHHFGSAISIIAVLHLLQINPGWRFMLPLALYSCLPLCLGILSKLRYSYSFLAEVFSHPWRALIFSHHLPKSSTVRLFLHNLSPLHVCQWFFSFCFQRLVEAHLA